MLELKISPSCRKCSKLLSEAELQLIRKQIEALHYPNIKGTWHGLCMLCKKDTEPFVVS